MVVMFRDGPSGQPIRLGTILTTNGMNMAEMMAVTGMVVMTRVMMARVTMARVMMARVPVPRVPVPSQVHMGSAAVKLQFAWRHPSVRMGHRSCPMTGQYGTQQQD